MSEEKRSNEAEKARKAFIAAWTEATWRGATRWRTKAEAEEKEARKAADDAWQEWVGAAGWPEWERNCAAAWKEEQKRENAALEKENERLLEIAKILGAEVRRAHLCDQCTRTVADGYCVPCSARNGWAGFQKRG